MPSSRERLIARTREQLDRTGYPRVQLSLIVGVSGLAAFLVSYLLLQADVASMALRYGVAGTAAYLVFLVLLAAWVSWKRRSAFEDHALDLLDVANVLPTPTGGSTPGASMFAGGRSGGGGATDSWGAPVKSSARGGAGSWIDGDSDLGWVILLVAVVVGGVAAVGWVIWIAPALFAELLVDGVIVTAVSRGMERRDWTVTLLRRTIAPALLLIVLLVLGGYALQRLSPESRSIGPALESILE